MTESGAERAGERQPYEPPLLEDLGTLAELTLGSTTGPNLDVITTTTLGEVSGSI